MKRLTLVLSILILAGSVLAQSTSLETFLKAQPEIKSVEAISGNDFFNSTYKVMFEQAVDHSDPAKGTFLQRVFIADKAKESPVVFITEGYSAYYAAIPQYINELSDMLNANQICVEHRYFGESWPEPLNWEYLTVRNAAADQHQVLNVMKRYFSGKWISTGISKGGQTAVYHRWLYPNDVDVSIPYVAPLNFGLEDGRHEPFIAQIPGTAEQRRKVLDFQTAILKNRDIYLPKLDSFCKQKNYTFRISMDEVLDYCVLEYSFALWQWGRLTDQIPEPSQSADKLFEHLMIVSGPSYFAIEDMESIKSFFVQAAVELGYYGYDIRPFRKYLSIKTAKNYLGKIFLPENVKLKYDKKPSREVKKFIESGNAKILFVYGGWDPWFASGFSVSDKENLLRIVKEGGSHSTRIKNLPDDQKQVVKTTLEKWLEMPVNLN